MIMKQMSEAAWLHPQKCLVPPGSVFKSIQGCLAPSADYNVKHLNENNETNETMKLYKPLKAPPLMKVA